MKRVFLFVVTNLAVVFLLSIVVQALGLDQWLAREGIGFIPLLILAAIFGMGGAMISLLISKPIAKWSTGAKTITGREGPTEAWLVQTVASLAAKARLQTPEVAVYDGAPNAFATGAFKNSALVAVSTGLLSSMSRDEVKAVLGHEMAHVANGDMVTMSLLQGILNTFVIMLSYVLGYIVDKAVFKNKRGLGMGYYLTRMAAQLLFGIMASIIVMAYSRRREFAADSGSADLTGSTGDMIAALKRLGGLKTEPLPENMRALGIADKRSWTALLSSHPPIETRIARLEARQQRR